MSVLLYHNDILSHYFTKKGEDMKNLVDALGIADKILQNPYITTGFLRREGLTQPEAEAVYQHIIDGKNREQLAAEIAEWLQG